MEIWMNGRNKKREAMIRDLCVGTGILLAGRTHLGSPYSDVLQDPDPCCLFRCIIVSITCGNEITVRRLS